MSPSPMNINNKNKNNKKNIASSPMNINRPPLPRLPRLQTRPTRSKPNSETDLIIKVKLPLKTVQQLRRIMYDTDKKRYEYMGTIDMTRSNNGDIVFDPPSRCLLYTSPSPRDRG